MLKIINKLSSAIVKKILSLHVFGDYTYYNFLSHTELSNYFKKKYLNDSGNFLVYETSDDFAVSSIQFLQWDTDNLNMNAAKIDLLQYSSCSSLYEMISEIDDFCIANSIEYLTIRLNTASTTLLNALQKNDYHIIDGILTFSQKTAHRSYCFFNAEEVITEKDIQQVAAIAKKIYRYDRFHSDECILKETADQLHYQWLYNSCKDENQKVLIMKENDQIQGYINIKIDEISSETLRHTVGKIILVGVADQFRKKGIASKLNSAALYWFQQNNADIVEVGTQVSNIPASRLYVKSGFEYVNSLYTLRKRFNYDADD